MPDSVGAFTLAVRKPPAGARLLHLRHVETTDRNELIDRANPPAFRRAALVNLVISKKVSANSPSQRNRQVLALIKDNIFKQRLEHLRFSPETTLDRFRSTTDNG
jgi:hypothetical protein